MKTKNKFSPDIIDKQIIEQLKQNGRKPYRQIAKQLHLSVGTITNRIQKLEEEGIIQGFKIELDYHQLGYELESIINIQTTQNMKTTFQNEKYQKHIITAHHTTGKYDIIVHARFKNVKELQEFLNELKNEEIVIKTNTQVIMATLNNYMHQDIKQ